MPFFVIACLLLSGLVFLDSPYLPLLVDPTVTAVGAMLGGASLLLGALKRASLSTWADGVASGALLVWYADWQPQFVEGAPMFRFFPLYYAALAGWLTLVFVGKTARFDAESRQALRGILRLVRFDIRLLAAIVLASLAFPEHYLLYPMMTSVFVVRFTLQRCLEIIDSLET